ncbi:MAG TPA: lactate utilization protein [Blastocatellia bacterium]|nr:lactate utilization protein [Blastocatellia bacterium]
MAKQRRPRLIKQFDSELTRIGGKVHYARSASEVGDLLLHLAEELRARNLVVWEDRNLPDAEYLRSFDAAGLKVHFEDREGDPESFLRKAAQADIGITSVDYALADTATLVLISGEGRARSVSLLPPVHVAILDTEKILPGLDELFGLLGGHPPGSAVTFITGPSRTADIELTLVVGVHGPQELHVVLLEK